MDFGTSITIEMFLQAPQTSILKCYMLPSVFQRLFICTSNGLLATNLLNQILLHNQRYFTPEVITPNYVKSGMKVIFEKETSNIHFVKPKSDVKEVISGFLIGMDTLPLSLYTYLCIPYRLSTFRCSLFAIFFRRAYYYYHFYFLWRSCWIHTITLRKCFSMMYNMLVNFHLHEMYK